MEKKMIVALGVLLLAGILIVSPHTDSVTVHADTHIWLIGWAPHDYTTGNFTYGFTVTWADDQQSTITITSDWGDGTLLDSITSTGSLNPMFTLPTYTDSQQTYHDYKIAGTFSHIITLTDSLGNGYSKTVIVTVAQNNAVYGFGGRLPVQM